jgi:hypothetical protein
MSDHPTKKVLLQLAIFDAGRLRASWQCEKKILKKVA